MIKPLPNVEETDRYITSRLLVAGAERTDIFSPGAIARYVRILFVHAPPGIHPNLSEVDIHGVLSVR